MLPTSPVPAQETLVASVAPVLLRGFRRRDSAVAAASTHDLWMASVAAIIAGVGRWRRRTPPIGARVVAPAAIIGIGDTGQEASGSRGLALLVTRKRAVAQARLVVALEAEGIADANRFSGLGAERRQTADGQ